MKLYPSSFCSLLSPYLCLSPTLCVIEAGVCTPVGGLASANLASQIQWNISKTGGSHMSPLSRTLFISESCFALWTCAPSSSLLGRVCGLPSLSWLPFPSPFLLSCRLPLLQTCATLCRALWFERRVYIALKRRWGLCGLLGFNAHSVDMCVWLLFW